MKKTLIIISIILFSIIGFLFITVFFGQLNYMNETKYSFNLFKGDFLYKNKNSNISLGCGADAIWYYRVTIEQNNKSYGRYSEDILLNSLNTYYIFKEDTIQPVTQTLIGTREDGATAYSNKTYLNGKETIIDSTKFLHSIEIQIPKKLHKNSFVFVLEINAQDDRTHEQIIIEKKFEVEFGTHFGYRGFPLLVP